MMAVQPEPCTTPAASKRHYSDHLGSSYGCRTLCGLAGAMGQDKLNALRPGRRAPLIADLPDCKPCIRTKEKRDG